MVTPVVLTGCLDAWPLVADLQHAGTPGAQLDILDGLVGQRKVQFTQIAPQHQGHLGYADDLTTTFEFKSTKRKVAFADFSKVLRGALTRGDGGAVYMQSVPLGTFPALPPLVPDLPYLQAITGYRQLWIGSGGHVVNLHFDPTHNLIAMLAGEKRITLVPPDNLADMYPAPLDRRLGDAIGSRIKLLSLDPDKFPLALDHLARAQVATLGPGDVLYIPPMWWHHVESFGLNVMINKWVPPITGDHFGDLTANLVRGILTYHDMPSGVRQHYRRRYAPLFGMAAAPAHPPIDPPVDPRILARANHHLAESAKVLAGVPDCLLKTLPQLYDYYVFHAAGEPSLSASDTAGFMRRLRWFLRAVGTFNTVKAIATSPARLFNRPRSATA